MALCQCADSGLQSPVPAGSKMCSAKAWCGSLPHPSGRALWKVSDQEVLFTQPVQVCSADHIRCSDASGPDQALIKDG